MKTTGLFVLFLFLFFAFCEKASAEDLPLVDFSFSAIPENITLKIETGSYALSRAQIEKWIVEKSKLTYSKSYTSEIENTRLCQYWESIACSLSFDSRKSNHIRKNSSFFLKEEPVKDFLESLALKFDRPPEDAKFKLEDGKVSAFSLNQSGIALDQDKSLLVLKEKLTNTSSGTSWELPVNEISSNTSIDSIDTMGIKELLGEGHSNFRGSTASRIHNIKTAVERYNGLLIRPGEEFSFVKVLGEVDGEHGYLPELVIKKDKTEPEFGGGICQVSTTAFRAAIYSGLEVTARRNHAYPVSYYNPQGMDSTVYVPRPDLKFKNDTNNYILIQTKIEGTELTFSFYGTSDGRKTNVIGPKILEKNPDGSMKTTFTQQVLDANDNIIREDVFNSSYDSPAKYPHPTTTTEVLTQKPASWSDKEWRLYKKSHGL